MNSRIPPIVGIIGVTLFIISIFYVWFSLDLFVSTDVGTFTTRADILPAKGLKVELWGHSLPALTEDQLRPLQNMGYVTTIYGSNIFEIFSFIILFVTIYLAVHSSYFMLLMHKKRGLGDKLMWVGVGGIIFLVVIYLIMTTFARSLSVLPEEPISLGLVTVNGISYAGFLFNFGAILLIVASAAIICTGLLYREIERTTLMV
jgi:hypothetical protein